MDLPNIRAPLVDEQRRMTNFWWDWFHSIANRQSFTGTITLAKLTTSGANGQMVFRNGILISQTPAT